MLFCVVLCCGDSSVAGVNYLAQLLHTENKQHGLIAEHLQSADPQENGGKCRDPNGEGLTH